MGRQYLAGIALASLWVCTAAPAQDAQHVISEASKALGVESLKSVQYSATGFDFAFGQAATPGTPWPKFIEKSYTRAVDFQHPASRVERVRLQGENPPHGGGGQPLVGEQPQTQTIIIDDHTAWTQQLEIWLLPHGFLHTAATRNPTVTAKTIGGKRYRVVSFTGDNGAKVNGYIDAQNRVERVETWIDTPVLGDTLLEADYSDYRDEGGVLFPRHIVQKQGGYPIFDLTVSEVKINVPLDIQPQSIDGAAAVAANPSAKSERLGEGLYLITGGYAVIAVEFKDHITLLESGQNEPRALAVIAETKRLIPNKPIKYVVNTHSHFDHSGGLRAFVAEGTTILTYRTNKAYLEGVLAKPHNINPDKAQVYGRKPRVEAVGEQKILTDGTQVVQLYHLQKFPHHDGMLVAFFPQQKLLFEADAYNPQPAGATAPYPPNVFNVSLLDNIQRLGLDVQRIVPVHYPADGRTVTLAELSHWAGQVSSKN